MLLPDNFFIFIFDYPAYGYWFAWDCILFCSTYPLSFISLVSFIYLTSLNYFPSLIFSLSLASLISLLSLTWYFWIDKYFGVTGIEYISCSPRLYLIFYLILLEYVYFLKIYNILFNVSFDLKLLWFSLIISF